MILKLGSTEPFGGIKMSNFDKLLQSKENLQEFYRKELDKRGALDGCGN
jgi:hypothetical protein